MRRSSNTAYGVYHNSAILPNTTSAVHQTRTIDRIRCTEKICTQCTLVQVTEFAISEMVRIFTLSSHMSLFTLFCNAKVKIRNH